MKLRQLLGMHTSLSAAVGFGWALIVPYFISLGFNEVDILLYFLSFFTFPLIWFRVTRNWKIKNYLTFGLMTRATCFILAMSVTESWHMILVGIFFSFIMTDYWAVYNTLVEDNTKKENRAFINSLVMGIVPVVNMFTPIVAGYIADQHGFFWMLATGFVLMSIPVALSRGMSSKRMLMNLWRANHNNRHIYEVMFLEGFSNAAGWAIPMFVTLKFVTTNMEFGTFFSYLALLGVISSLILSKRSDKKGQRRKYITPVMIMNGIGLIIAGFADSFLMWTIGLSIYNIFLRIEWPVTWAMVTESTRSIGDAMIAREFWLNVGRATMIAITTLAVVSNLDIQFSLVIGGIGYLLFPVFMKFRKLG